MAISTTSVAGCARIGDSSLAGITYARLRSLQIVVERDGAERDGEGNKRKLLSRQRGQRTLRESSPASIEQLSAAAAKGVIGMATKEGATEDDKDFIEHLFMPARTTT